MSSIEQQTHTSSFNELNGLVLDQDKKFFDLLNIHIKSLQEKEPIDIDFQQELHHFLHANLLKPFESQQLKMKYLNAILEPKMIRLLKLCFWYILCTRFPETVDVLVQDEIQQYYKRKLSRNYVKLFQSLPQPKDDLVNYVIFTLSYLIHFCFYKYFPPQREFFDFRFTLNCYHTILYEFNGIFVSDIYIKVHIEKFFTHKFLDYEKKNRKELLQKQIELKKLNNKKFLGFNLQFPNITNSKDGQEFKDKILTSLKKDRNRFSIAQAEQDLRNEKERMNSQNKNRMHQSLVNSSGHFSINKTISHTENDSVLSNLKINCNQVSPTLGKLLEYEDLNLPFKKKKMIKHVFEKVDNNQNDLLTQMKMMFQEKQTTNKKKKELKVSQRGKTLIDHYNLRAPPKEYYQRHQKLGKYCKDMLDINYVLTENNEKMSNLPSSIELLHLFNNKFVGKMHQQLEEKMLEDKLVDQKKQIDLIESLKKESGNQDIFDQPFDGSRSEGRKLIAYVRAKCRKELQQKDLLLKQQKEGDKVEQDLRLKRVQSEGLVLQTQFSQPQQSLMAQKTLITSKLSKLDMINTSQEVSEQLTKKAQPFVNFNFNGQTPQMKDISLLSYLSPQQESLSRQHIEMESPSKFFSMKKTQQIETSSFADIVEKPDKEKTEDQRRIKSVVVQQGEISQSSQNGNLPDYILQRSLDPGILYEDKRLEYKSKYNKIFEGMSIDQNINDLCHNIMQKRNLFSHGLKKKSHQ